MNTMFASPNVAQARWYQDEAIQSIFDYFDNGGRGNPLIAMPTASGKTHVISGFIKRVLHQWPSQRFIVGTHVKELIEQNANKFSLAWPHAPYGIHSAGLGARDYMQPIIFGGVQSMVKNIEKFGHRDLLIIDEAHLVSPKEGTNWQKFISGLRNINPYLKVIGLSATIYRQATGLLTEPHEGQIFTDICYDLTTMEAFARLIAEGYLAPLIPKRTSIEIDVSEVAMSNTGDFNQKQLQAAANREKITFAALQEACRYGQHRYSWLAFAAGIEHAENIAAMLNSWGISSVCVHSKITDDERDKRIELHKQGRVRCLVGNNIFTTGYDHPPLDFIIDLQPTMSVAKHVQKYGRGMRVSPQTYKQDCLVMDFGGNTRRNGPINDPYIPKARRKGAGDAPVKICEACGTYNHASARFCIDCGEPFEFKTKIVREAETEEILKSDLPVIERYKVDRVLYMKAISKKNQIPMLVVQYWSGLSSYLEHVLLEHPGNIKNKAKDWWRQRHQFVEPPLTVDEALRFTHELRIPQYIHVWINRKYPEITKVDW